MGLKRASDDDETAMPSSDNDSHAHSPFLCGVLAPQECKGHHEKTQAQRNLYAGKVGNAEKEAETDACKTDDGLFLCSHSKPRAKTGVLPLNPTSQLEISLKGNRYTDTPVSSSTVTTNLFTESGGSFDEKEAAFLQEPFLDFFSDEFLHSTSLDFPGGDIGMGIEENAPGDWSSNAAEWNMVTRNPFADISGSPAEDKERPTKRVRFQTKAKTNLHTPATSQRENVQFLPSEGRPKPPPLSYGEMSRAKAVTVLDSQIPFGSTNNMHDSQPLQDSARISTCQQISNTGEPAPAYFIDVLTLDIVHKTRSGNLRYVGVQQEGWKIITTMDSVSVHHQDEAQGGNTFESIHFTTGWAHLESRVEDPSTCRLVVQSRTMLPSFFILAIVPGMDFQVSLTNTLTVRVRNYTAQERCELVTLQGFSATKMDELKAHLLQVVTMNAT